VRTEASAGFTRGGTINLIEEVLHLLEPNKYDNVGAVEFSRDHNMGRTT
jgi:hypothetical protein